MLSACTILGTYGNRNATQDVRLIEHDTERVAQRKTVVYLAAFPQL